MGEIIRHVTEEQKNIVNGITPYEDYQMAEELAEQTPTTTVDFNLKSNVDLSVAKDIKKNLKNAEEVKKAEENMKTWKMQLSTVETKTEQIMIAMEFELDVLIEALRRNVERVDDIYLMFCKKEDRKPMHSDALNKLMEDMKAEHEEIVPYITEAEEYKNKMM